MAKTKIKVPKGYKCANGEVCSQDLELDVDIPEIKPTVERLPELEVTPPGIAQTQQYAPPPQVPPVAPPPAQVPSPAQQMQENQGLTTEELQDLMPTGVNFAECKGNNCADFVIKNKKFTKKFKSCPKCGCNNVPVNSNLCPCCGRKADEDDEDAWDESDIELKSDDDDEDED